MITNQDMPEAFLESSKIMKTGRAYKNIHAILNKYPRRRMGYPQTAGKVQYNFYCLQLLVIEVSTDINFPNLS
jgi:hypothetical protein